MYTVRLVKDLFEWKQNLEGKHWSKEEVNRKLKKKMEEATEAVWNESKRLNKPLRCREGCQLCQVSQAEAA